MGYRSLALMLILTCLSASLNAAEDIRWYNADQVAEGKKLFSVNCATCHGVNAQATPEWRKRDAKGDFVPPPLNGTAHAWHHPMNILRFTIRKGGAPVGGTMPAFGNKLTPTEIDSIIAWFQSLWKDDIYKIWQQRNAIAER